MIGERESAIIYKIITVFLIIVGAAAVMVKCYGKLPLILQEQCGIYKYLGIYCFGCGGTRAVAALLQFKLIESFLYHPAVICTLLFMIYYFIRNNRIFIKITHKEFKLFKPTWLYILLGIVILQCVIKNIFFMGYL